MYSSDVTILNYVQSAVFAMEVWHTSTDLAMDEMAFTSKIKKILHKQDEFGKWQLTDYICMPSVSGVENIIQWLNSQNNERKEEYIDCDVNLFL